MATPTREGYVFGGLYSSESASGVYYSLEYLHRLPYDEYFINWVPEENADELCYVEFEILGHYLSTLIIMKGYSLALEMIDVPRNIVLMLLNYEWGTPITESFEITGIALKLF